MATLLAEPMTRYATAWIVLLVTSSELGCTARRDSRPAQATTMTERVATTWPPATQASLAQDAPPREGPDAAVWWIDRCYAELRALETPRREVKRGSIGDTPRPASGALHGRNHEEAGQPEPEGHLLMLGIVAKAQRGAGDEAGLARTEAWMNELRKLGDPEDVERYTLYYAWREAPGPPREKARATVAAATQPLQRQEALRDAVFMLMNDGENYDTIRGGPADLAAARDLLAEVERPVQDRIALTLVEALLKSGDVAQAGDVFRGVTMLPPRELVLRHDVIGRLALAQAKARRAKALDYTLARLREGTDAKLDRGEGQLPLLILVAIYDAERAAGRTDDAARTLRRAEELAVTADVWTGHALKRLFGAQAVAGDFAATERVIAAIPRKSAARDLPPGPSDALLYSLAELGQLEAGQFVAARRTRGRMRELGLRAGVPDFERHWSAVALLKAGMVEDLADVLTEVDAGKRWERLWALRDQRDAGNAVTLADVANALPPPASPVQRFRAAQVYVAASQNERAAGLLRRVLDDVRGGWKPPDEIQPGEILFAMRDANALDVAAGCARRLSPAHLPAIARAYARAGNAAQAKALIAERLAQLEAAPPGKRAALDVVALATAAGAVGDQALFDRLIVRGTEAALESKVQLWGGETGTWQPLCRAYRAAGRMKDLASVVDRIEQPSARAIANLVAAQELSGTKLFDVRAPEL